MKIINALLFTGILLQLSALAFAVEAIEVVTESWEPYSYLLPDGSVGGTATAKVRRILDKAGIEYTINLYPWTRAYRTALSKRNVLIYSIYRTKERELKFQWLCPFLPTERIYAYALADRRDINIGKLDDLKQYIIGSAREEYAYQFLLEHGFEDNRHLDISSTYNTSLHKLVNHRIDLVIGTRHSIDTRLKSLGYPETKMRAVYEFSTQMIGGNCMAFNIETPSAVVEKVRAALLQVNQAAENASAPE
ncbi:substrate-binding periplasmic protein [Thalassomonas actiniarum]|uniref:Transporter substrate-binding domain-containing protein n=1 Tax=Thalassomonas actiniarum TaxID=485447 RepID=A0AAF0C6G8_9GAMM|nr:transporter substrate-binding domain-containing protein [Thalassomonas actiniarum]WDE02251.1 transporter substrate-binding domain-containing protein [Thalassomonas actiniarum]